MTLRSLLPLVWNEDAVIGFDAAFRNVLAGSLANADDTRQEVYGLSDVLDSHATGESGLYQGPVALMPYYAEHTGNLLWTPDAIDIFGESYLRRILGDRIISGENLGRYAALVNAAAGKLEAIQLIAELQDASVNVVVGVFDKSASATDKTQWVMRPQADPSTVRPTGIDVTLSRATRSALTVDEVEYLTTVIERVIPYTLVDVRISTIFVQPVGVFMAAEVVTETDYGDVT